MRYLLGPVGLALLSLPAGAAELVSETTDLYVNRCTVLESDEFGQAVACPGLNGYPVIIIEGDMQMYVSFGLKSESEKAARQTLPTVTWLDGEMEWLLPPDDSMAPPIATILRWFTQVEQAAPAGEVLVVTQLKSGATCHIAYVDALANKNANELARQAAGDLAGDFDCENTRPQIYGEFAAFDLE
jgi:hypothetical protein